MPTSDGSQYRRQAAKCLERAQATNDQNAKLHWLAMAGSWKDLADSVEKITDDPQPKGDKDAGQT
jgi:hypothetical protein